MKKKIRKYLTVLLLAVFLVSTAMMIRQHFDNQKAADSYSEAQRLASLSQPISETEPAPQETQPAETGETIWVPAPVEDDSNMESLKDTNLAALREVNEDVVGWILIPGTDVNYPVMQGDDNDHYLEYTWDGKHYAVGSIFLECMNSPGLTDFNTIVYGHNMQNGSMFACLRKYAGQDYWTEHPYVYLASDAGVYRYEVFSAYEAKVGSGTYSLNIQKEETKQAYLDMALNNSEIDTGITPAVTDRVLTLSTCSGAGYSTRWVVHARLQMIETTV